MGWSRAEQILQAGIAGESWDGTPHSRLESLLVEFIESGGGGGVEPLTPADIDDLLDILDGE